jgi:hypothetical protein
MTQYYKTYNPYFSDRLVSIAYAEGIHGSRTRGAWAEFVNGFKMEDELLMETDYEYMLITRNDSDGRAVWIWRIDEDEWRHRMVDRLCVEMDFGLIEKLIADIGIMNAFKMATDTGLMDAVEMEELGTEMGIRKLFYCVLDAHLYFNETDQFEEISAAEWEAYDDAEPADTDDDEDEEEQEVIPLITDDAFVRIGFATPPCA